MPYIHPRRHDWAFIGMDSKYEYSQCQWPTCRKLTRTNLRTGKVEYITLKDIPQRILEQ